MGDVVLITGCSSGFGLGSAVDLARHGFTVVATMRDLARREALDSAAREAGVPVEVEALDVTGAASIERAVAAVLARHGRIDAVVNNAGYGQGGFVYDLSMEELRAQMETNFFGAVAVTKAVLPSMIARRAGRIVQISSLNGRVALPVSGAYCASKFALEGFSESLRYETRPYGVWVSIIEPGAFKTSIDQKRRTAAGASDPSSPYRAHTERMKSLYRSVGKRRPPPQPVLDAIRRALTDAEPKLRYLVGKDAHALATMKAVSPALLERAILSKTTPRT